MVSEAKVLVVTGAVRMRLVLDGLTPPSSVDQTLLRTGTRGDRWADDLLWDRVQSVAEIGPGANG